MRKATAINESSDFHIFSLWNRNVAPLFIKYTVAVGTFRLQVRNLLDAQSLTHTFHTWRA